MKKIRGSEVKDTTVGKYIEVYDKFTYNEPIGLGAGKLVNYEHDGDELRLIFAGSFKPKSFTFNCFVQVFDLDDEGNVS